MSIAVVVFPGTNCDHDVVHALEMLGTDAELVWHRDVGLDRFDGIVLPGGFAHGDYLRTGAIARFSPVMDAVVRLAAAGRPVLGICNGFQILCEAGLLPGALVANRDLRFICRPVHVRVESTSIATTAAEMGDVLRLPLNSYEGNYVPPSGGISAAGGRVVLRYCGPGGAVDPGDATTNPNGSHDAIAAVANEAGNVVGLMPHPERATEPILGSSDGRVVLESFVAATMRAVAPA